MMTNKFEYDGTLVWWRTDSYWDATSYIMSSTWWPGLVLSAHFKSTIDNNGTTDNGKQYVFAWADGSGVQMGHLTYND